MKKYEDMNTKERLNYSICKNHTGKMTGIWSISTSPLCNSYCMARRAESDSSIICSDCYACRMCKMYRGLAEKLEKNSSLYMGNYLKREDVPVFRTKYGRFESFGDLANTLQLFNYCLIAEMNPATSFALWTKNTWLLIAYANMGGTFPNNLTINISSVYKSTPVTPEELAKLRGVVPIDHVFTVYDNETTAREKGVKINCGKKSCNTCGICYHHNGIDYINELLK